MTRRTTSDFRASVPSGLAVLEPFVDAGVFSAYEVQFAATVSRLQPGLSDVVLLALAVAARAPRFGHVCWRLSDMSGQMAGLDGEVFDALGWPAGDEWAAALGSSEVVAGPGHATAEPLRPLVLDAGRLYLQRYWRYELAVAGDLLGRAHASADRSGDEAGTTAEWSGAAADEALDVMFGPSGTDGPDLQRLAARRGMHPGVSIIAGGPGTGKTYTVARLLAAAHRVAEQTGNELKVALAAPTGKAAARMGDAVNAAVQALEAGGAVDHSLSARLVATVPTTVHSLLGWRDRTHFRHGRDDPLRHDLVIIDETSMVSLPLMAKLLDAVRPDARLVLVGDPFQLASIEAGTVMRDVVGPAEETARVVTLEDRPVRPDRAALAGRVTVLKRMRRFGEDSAIAALADAIRRGDTDSAVSLLAGQRADVGWVEPDDATQVDRILDEVATAGAGMVVAALDGDASGALAAGDRGQGADRHPSGAVGPRRVDRADRSLGCRAGCRVPTWSPLVRGAAGPGDGERPGERSLQRGCRRRHRPGGRLGGRSGDGRRGPISGAIPARWRRDVVGHDHPQEPGLRVRPRDRVPAGPAVTHPQP